MRYSFLLSFLGVILLGKLGHSQTLWTGPKITFTKASYADWTLAENQDRITDSVWITRADMAGIFNIVMEEEYDRDTNISPMGTEWAIGSIEDGIENLSFGTWFSTLGGAPTEQIGLNKVLHLISEDIYIDVELLSWTPGGGGSGTGQGGGFSYQRSTDPATSTNQVIVGDKRIFPNPADSEIRILGLKQPVTYSVFDLTGTIRLRGTISNQERINIQSLQPGLYLLQFANRQFQKFIKN